MGKTKRIPSAEWLGYFDRFSRSFLADDGPQKTTVEVISATLGSRIEALSARFLGISYEPESNALQVQLEDPHPLAFQPAEIWVIEEEGGFVSAIEVKRLDGGREILCVHRSAPLARRYEAPFFTQRG